MEEYQIRVGLVYWAEFAGRQFRVKALAKLDFWPGWWDCLVLGSDSVRSLPSHAFIGLDAADDTDEWCGQEQNR